MKADISFEDKEYQRQLNKKSLKKWIESVLLELKKEDCYCAIVFVAEESIRQLNKNYRNKDKVTDVLSFSQIEGEEIIRNNKFLGDIVICLKIADEQAKQYKHSLLEEVQYLILHGILHLLGYDHDKDETSEMSLMERDLYKRLTGVCIE